LLEGAGALEVWIRRVKVGDEAADLVGLGELVAVGGASPLADVKVRKTRGAVEEALLPSFLGTGLEEEGAGTAKVLASPLL
jgi:hypothetical protein